MDEQNAILANAQAALKAGTLAGKPLDEVTRASLEAIVAAHAPQPASISETGPVSSDELHLDMQVIRAKIEMLEALVQFMLPRGADPADILRKHQESLKGSEVIDPAARRG